jgi:23S rRNA U2552 (ribose-2'-O)-methylase RlmE/FtsJ
VKLDLPYTYTYNQDIQDTAKIKEIIATHGVQKFDAIISDMAPNTI